MREMHCLEMCLASALLRRSGAAAAGPTGPSFAGAPARSARGAAGARPPPGAAAEAAGSGRGRRDAASRQFYMFGRTETSSTSELRSQIR